MMRPSTLAEAVERVRSGEPLAKAWPEFVDNFLLARDDPMRFAMLAIEPTLTGDVKLDALAGATAEYLSKHFQLGRVPDWAAAPSRYLAEPWFTTTSTSLAMLEYLTFASPAEFRSRNIFTEERPLRRARTHLVSRTAAAAE
jgi:hypothetical protein